MRPPDKPRVTLRRPKTPAHLASGAPVSLRRTSGEWDVWAPPIAGPPFMASRQLAGPFDTREEAEAWIAGQ